MQVAIELSVLLEMMKTAKQFVRKDDMTPYNCFKVKIDNDHAYILALDGFRMVNATYPIISADDPFTSFTLPVFDVPKGKGAALIDVHDHDIIVDFGSSRLTLKGPDEIRPDWDTFAPKNDVNFEICFNAQGLADTLKSFGKAPVRMQFRGNKNAVIIIGENKRALVLPLNPGSLSV